MGTKRCPDCRRSLPITAFMGPHDDPSILCRACAAARRSVHGRQYRGYTVVSGAGLTGRVVGLRLTANEISVRFAGARLVRLQLRVVGEVERETETEAVTG